MPDNVMTNRTQLAMVLTDASLPPPPGSASGKTMGKTSLLKLLRKKRDRTLPPAHSPPQARDIHTLQPRRTANLDDRGSCLETNQGC